MRYYVVDAFTDAVFSGNPAGVCVAEQELSAAMMQQIAAENNLSETAFVVKRGEPGEYGLRWFTPKAEIDLCGHATLGAAYVIARYVAPRVQCMHFYTQVSGELTVRCSKGLFELDFPAPRAQACGAHSSHAGGGRRAGAGGASRTGSHAGIARRGRRARGKSGYGTACGARRHGRYPHRAG